MLVLHDKEAKFIPLDEFISGVRRETIGIIGQWIGALLILAGLIYEIVTRVSWGIMAITLGSLTYAISTKLKK